MGICQVDRTRAWSLKQGSMFLLLLPPEKISLEKVYGGWLRAGTSRLVGKQDGTILGFVGHVHLFCILFSFSPFKNGKNIFLTLSTHKDVLWPGLVHRP